VQCRSVFNVHARASTTAMIEERIEKSRRGGATHKPDRLREWLDTPVHLYSSRILTFDLLAARIAGALSDRRPRPRAQTRAARASCAAALRCHSEYRRCRHVPLESLCPFTHDATAKAIRSAFAGSEETRRNMARGQRSELVRLRKRYFGWRSRRQTRGASILRAQPTRRAREYPGTCALRSRSRENCRIRIRMGRLVGVITTVAVIGCGDP